MGAGLPVLCSDLPVLREIAGEAALFFNPDDVEDIQNKMERVIKDVNLQKELIAKGQERCQRFSWETTARQTLDYILK